MRLAILILALACGWNSARAAEDLILAPHLTDNMVVGRSTKFYGLAPARERVRIQIKGRRSDFEVRAGQDGKWQKDVSFSYSANPLEIEFYLGTNKSPSRLLTNVVVGEILVAGIAFGQGIPADPKRATSAIRFIKLDSLAARAPSSSAPQWQIADAQGLAAGDCDLLALEHALSLARNGVPVGIVQVHESIFAASARIGEGSFPEELKKRIESVNIAADSAIRKRADEVRANKRNGRIAVVPPINNYENHMIYSPGLFRAKTEIPLWLEFDSAIGPREIRR